MTAASTTLGLLAEWVGQQRWFAGKGIVPALRTIGSWNLQSDQDVLITTYLVLDDNSIRPVLYQVPVTQRRSPLESGHAALIAESVDDDGAPAYLYDGPYDPAYAESLLRFATSGGHANGDRAHADGVAVGVPECINIRSHVLAGEQSNTSIVYDYETAHTTVGHRAICKVFRTLHHGENPDVVLQSALFAAGSHSVPATLGSVVGDWPDSGQQSGRAQGHLAFVQQFLPDAEDAWTRARAFAAGGMDFAPSARAIGMATADIHSTLAAVMPTTIARNGDIAEIVAGWLARLDAAVAEVPQLAALREPIESQYAHAAECQWPRLQRIHGDLHLGQVLALPGGGWAIIDFEGEPMRPLSERNLPDVTWRDVAGMLRSFDYVAGAEPNAPDVAAWAEACRIAFIDGYSERSGEDLRAHRILVDAFELDKAVYEAVYEARNRPAWLPIPTAAVRRLAERAPSRG